MQAKNYAAQVVKSLDTFIPNYQKMLKANGDKYFGLEAEHLKTLQGVIKNAVHFTMPDGGVLLDDSLKGLKSSEIRLPFQSITIECFIPDDGSFNELTPNICEKRLIVATETNSDVMKHINDIVISNKEKLGVMGDLLAKGFDANSKGIDFLLRSERVITISAFFMNRGFWTPCYSQWIIPCDWDSLHGTTQLESLIKKDDDAVAFAGHLGFLLPSILDMRLNSVTPAYAMKEAAHDIGGEVRIVLELLEALSCRNVEQTIIQKCDKALNARRINKGKLPLYEERILTIKVNAKQGTGTRTGTHESPRQHLRRGHIRRLESGNIWVNACVVGSSEKGVIKKSYNVVA